MGFSNQEKIKAAEELENARQAMRDLGRKATNTDRKRVESAEKNYYRVMGRKG